MEQSPSLISELANKAAGAILGVAVEIAEGVTHTIDHLRGIDYNPPRTLTPEESARENNRQGLPDYR